MRGYELLESGDLQKWERFGPYVLCRPAPQALWRAEKQIVADARFSREGKEKWDKVPSSWEVEIEGIRMKLSPTDFGHLGLFPEHAPLWRFIRERLSLGDRFLNLFAYSGGATMAALQAGASACHVDAAKGMIDWAKENLRLNHLEKSPVRWIVDDAMKFMKREIKRGSFYDAILLDPPTFGRGAKGEVFKIEEKIIPLLEMARDLLSQSPRFVLFSCHTPGMTPLVMSHLCDQIFPRKSETSEMLLEGKKARSIPVGSLAKIEFS